MPPLKRLALGGPGPALRTALRCRLLGEPCEAESLCLDVLAHDPKNRQAQVMLILSLTDQFGIDLSQIERAKELASRLEDEYERAYYSGIVRERLGRAQLARGGTGSDLYAASALQEAMGWFETAQAFRPSGDGEAALRWNTCLRTLARRGLAPPVEDPERMPLQQE